MFGRRKIKNELDAPPIATGESTAVEVLRVWAAPGKPQQLTLQTTWKEPAVWGLVLADIARHAANAYASQGYDPDEVLARILAAFQAEWAHPTDTAKDITPR
ncbi:DUF5076 domain-containing protein [Leptolyngbya sp. 15MV]|nr:DUF5076 domain-containing protein [Leptolyngbya sp. 15MV]